MIGKILLLILTALGLGVVTVYAIEQFSAPTHNVGALFGELLIGGAMALLVLILGGIYLYKNRNS
jgi:hypothetical protein